MVTRRPNTLPAILGTTLIILGCTVPETPLPPGVRRVVVHAVLDPAADTQYVSLNYSDSSGYSYLRIDGAQVKVITPEGVEMIAVEDTARYHASIYRFLPSAYGVTLMPGATYTLRIDGKVGVDVAGSTTIPSATPVHVPTASETFLWGSDTLRLDWPTVNGASAYRVEVMVSDFGYYGNSRPDTVFHTSYAVFRTHSLSLAGDARSLGDDYVFNPRGPAIVFVLAVDANFYDYYRVISDPFTGVAPSHLNGAVGVFGSVVPIIARRLDVH